VKAYSDQPPKRPKVELSAMLARDVAEFMARGGRVAEIPIGTTADHPISADHHQAMERKAAYARRHVRRGARLGIMRGMARETIAGEGKK